MDRQGGPPVLMYVQGAAGLSQDSYTWAKLLRDSGYETAAVGKWHLGWDGTWCGDNSQGPLGHGFNHFFGLPWTLVTEFEAEGRFWSLDKAGPSMYQVCKSCPRSCPRFRQLRDFKNPASTRKANVRSARYIKIFPTLTGFTFLPYLPTQYLSYTNTRHTFYNS